MMTLNDLLAASAATPEFRAAVGVFVAGGFPTDRITYSPGSPRIKVERVLAMILHKHPELPIESVAIDGRSGCEYFRGQATIRAVAEERRIAFDWDCKWKAMQLGWKDYFGFPDQTRAAREFGFDCIRTWDDLTVQLTA